MSSHSELSPTTESERRTGCRSLIRKVSPAEFFAHSVANHFTHLKDPSGAISMTADLFEACLVEAFHGGYKAALEVEYAGS